MDEDLPDEYIFPDKKNNLLNLYNSLIAIIQGKEPRIQLLKEYSGIDKIIFIYLDGVSYEALINLLPETIHNGLTRITSIYPATTASVVTSLATGAPPSKHGIFEWNLYIPKINMLIEPLVMHPYHYKYNDVLCKWGFYPSNLIKSRRLYSRLTSKNIKVFSFLRSYIVSSCYAKYILNGSYVIPYINVTDLAYTLARRVEQEEVRVFYYVYVEGIDSIGHLYGYNTPQYDKDLEYTLKILLEELRSIEKNKSETLLVITSDHGMNNVDSNKIIMLDETYPKLVRYLKRDVYGVPLVSGSPRDVYLHVKNGYIDRVMHILGDLEDIAVIVERDEVIKTLLKDIREDVIDRLGDIIILPKPGYGIWIRHYKDEYITSRGMHGGLSKDEMYIPFFTSKLDELGFL